MSVGMNGISCGAIMAAMSTFCSFFGSMEGDDVDEDQAVNVIGMSITLFPFHKGYKCSPLCHVAHFDQKANDVRK